MLIGVDRFPDEPGLADLPAVRANVASLRRCLTDPRTGVLDAGNCEVVDPRASVAEIGRAVGRAADEASDLLLIYYAGHGLVDDRGRLYLGTSATRTGSPKYSALAVDLLREDLGASGAAARVLILDCCFSGRAIDVMAGEEGVLDGQLSIAGTCTMTSTSGTAPSYAPAGERYTAFTGALLAALDSAEPLSLDGIYRAVAADLGSRGLPRPRQRTTDTAAALSLARGRTEPADTPGPDDPDRERFSRRSPAAARKSRGVRWRGAAAAAIFSPVLGLQVSGLTNDMRWTWGVPAAAAAIALAFAAATAPFRLKDAELVIDRSAVTTHLHYRNRTDTVRIAWEDVSHIGVLPLRNLRPAQVGWYSLLIVRPRPGALAADLPRSHVITRGLYELGYRSLPHTATVHTHHDQFLAALDRYAPVRVLRTKQDFMSHDPRVREDML
ncbi:caspase domain-containing protein [Kitasatospora sp. NPDC092948]|uniref:caspase family protein n=1 Tax=Kitasatospora sp. NPDC092948 TaxID=3364088 RepID=UPI0038284A61